MYRLYNKDAKLTPAGRHLNKVLQKAMARLVKNTITQNVSIVDLKSLLMGIVVVECAVAGMRLRRNKLTKKKGKIK